MGTIYCNDRKAFQTAVLLGMGAPFTIYNTWVANYPSTAFKVQYTSTISQTAIDEMVAGTINLSQAIRVKILSKTHLSNWQATSITARSARPSRRRSRR
jgi:hypothetical protein